MWVGLVAGGIAMIGYVAALVRGWNEATSVGLGLALVGAAGVVVARRRLHRHGPSTRGALLNVGSCVALLLGSAVMFFPWSEGDEPEGPGAGPDPTGVAAGDGEQAGDQPTDTTGAQANQSSTTAVGGPGGTDDGGRQTPTSAPPAQTTSPPTTPTTSPTTSRPTAATATGTVNGCNTFGENCEGNPIYRNLPPEPYDWQTWPKLATVANGVTLKARCWATGGTTTNYAEGDPGPNPYSSNVHYNVEAASAWGWIPDTYFVRNQASHLGLPRCPP